MAITVNNTLPKDWSPTIIYQEGSTAIYGNIIYESLIDNNFNNIPSEQPLYWKVNDIYKKDLSVMPCGDYSGDESFWERDQLYIDDNGYIYLNNENTGINVRGRDAAVVTFEDLTPEQKEQLRGDQGAQGERGPVGPTGPQGPPGEVTLTPEQVAALKGDDGKSAYEIWLDNGHTGSETDFLYWLQNGLVQLDNKLLRDSINAVQNQAIYEALMSYQIFLNAAMTSCLQRIEVLENRLKTIYNEEECLFRFGITDTGEYGYMKQGSDAVVPFNGASQDVMQSATVLPSFAIANSQYANPDTADSVTSVIDIDNNNIQASSLRGSFSIESDQDNGITYGNTPSIGYVDHYSYIYKDGAFVNNAVENYVFCNMSNNIVGGYLENNNEQNVEGIIFASNLGEFSTCIYIVVEPDEGETVSYEIGLGNAQARLPDVVGGINRVSYQNGTFSEKTTISYHIPDGYKPYFATTAKNKFYIKEIYLGAEV